MLLEVRSRGGCSCRRLRKTDRRAPPPGFRRWRAAHRIADNRPDAHRRPARDRFPARRHGHHDQWNRNAEYVERGDVQAEAIVFARLVPSLEVHDELHAFGRSCRRHAEEVGDVDQAEPADFDVMPRQFRARADQNGLAATADFDRVVRDESMTAADQIQRAFTLADAALPRHEHAQAENVEQGAVPDFARRHVIFQQRREARDRDRRRQRGPQQRDTGALSLRGQFDGAVQSHRDEHARKIAAEEPAQMMGARCRVELFEKADLALAKDEHAARPQVLVVPRERKACFLDIRQRDAAFETGGAGQQVGVEARGCAARAEQGHNRHARRHVTPPD